MPVRWSLRREPRCPANCGGPRRLHLSCRGCVGEFWTRICRAHLFPTAVLDDAFLLSNGVRFGKGLQLVNILRDLPVDLRHGRCYLPSVDLQAMVCSREICWKPAMKHDCGLFITRTWTRRSLTWLRDGVH